MKKCKAESILIIDDDATAKMLSEYVIARSGFNIKVSGFLSPTSAIDYLKQNENGWPDIILLDINMPMVNGWQFLDLLQEDIKKRFRHTMVCMLSSTIHEDDFERFHSRREAAFFLPKPLTAQHLEMVVGSHSHLRSIA